MNIHSRKTPKTRVWKIRVDEELDEALRLWAEEDDVDMSTQVRRIVRAALQKKSTPQELLQTA